jgi:outer membrane immunogenic protein
MKSQLIKLALLTSTLVPSLAFAADFEPPPPVDDLRPASYDWTGIYVGIWGGNACMDGTADDGNAPYLLAGCGVKGGIVAGYNYQVRDWVLGIEADYGFGSKIADNVDPVAAIGYNLNSIGTVRGRVGYAFDDTLLFLTAGAAFAEGELSGLAGASSTPFSRKEDHVGWTIGGGIEHAMTDNFRIRLDYLYTEMNNKVYRPCGTCNIDVDWGGEHEVRLGALWAFNWF